jgi:AcrR family transcriptional regulator
MEKYKKGIRTRNQIIEQVNQIFNERGLSPTLDDLANELGLTKGRITNYFPKKEKLLHAVVDHYEKKLQLLFDSYGPESQYLSLEGMTKFYSEIMDLNYEYRFAITFIAVNPLSDNELLYHIRDTYESKKKKLFERVKYLTETGQLNKELLQPEIFEVFCFQFINLSTTWVIHLELYDKALGYQHVKPVYLRGIMNCFFPYLTDKGRENMESALSSL